MQLLSWRIHTSVAQHWNNQLTALFQSGLTSCSMLYFLELKRGFGELSGMAMLTGTLSCWIARTLTSPMDLKQWKWTPDLPNKRRPKDFKYVSFATSISPINRHGPCLWVGEIAVSIDAFLLILCIFVKAHLFQAGINFSCLNYVFQLPLLYTYNQNENHCDAIW